MLELKDIRKKYGQGDSTVHALSGVSLTFRENEFVSILGPSGCGKTTLLNIIGGLDRYSKGDLVINGKSTKLFKDADWDTYRNHSIGFVFQSYNLIPHQSVLSNVELALTLSGVSKKERRMRAIMALKKVGLGDQIHKKPNQMSGGQMQRVAIARALVNNPDILLADEPTGALDTQTSIQIMDLLKEVAKEKLVIMVTHNPELAEEYSTRIVRLCDGLVVEDTDPFEIDVEEKIAIEAEKKTQKETKKKKKKMSFFTALSLSFNNLLTKKTRTLLTSFAGSIGIIGIALILSLSNGIQTYIDQVQEDTLSTYPLTIEKRTQDTSAMLSAMMQVSELEGEIDPNKIYVDDSLGTMMGAMTSTVDNDLESFKKYIEVNHDKIKGYVNDIQYTYDFKFNVFNFTQYGMTQVSPTTIFDKIPGAAGLGDLMGSMGGVSVMSEMINNQDLLDQQYELVGENSHWPTEANEVVLVVGKNNQISMMTLYMLGIEDQNEIGNVMSGLTDGNYESKHMQTYDLDYFLGMTLYMVNEQDYYEITEEKYIGKNAPDAYIWADKRDDKTFDKENFVKENGTKLVISGIIRPKADASSTSISGAIGYTKALTDKILADNANSAIINQQKKYPEYDVFSGSAFEKTVYTKDNFNEFLAIMDPSYKAMLYSSFKTAKDDSTLLLVISMLSNDDRMTLMTEIVGAAMQSNPEKFNELGGMAGIAQNFPAVLALLDDATKQSIFAKATEMAQGFEVTDEFFINTVIANMGDEEFDQMLSMLSKYVPSQDATLESNLELLGDAEQAKPASINFYAKDFESKDKIKAFIDEYNDTREDEKQQIQYSDLIGSLMSSISLIINVISYVLIAFVSISLIVSSIMIGIITYISVLERTKEIGILRSIGASKKDVSRVFNAETLIVGLMSGLMGILTTIVICLVANPIIHLVTGIGNINAILPWVGGVALVLISMFLTLIAGLLPSRLAAKKDPVEALRTE